LPIGKLLIGPAIKFAFAPERPPPGYIKRTGAEMILRPLELTANAEDLSALKAFVTAQAPHYGEIQTPTIVIAGDKDKTVPPDVHAKQLVKVLPHGRLIMLPGLGHMLHHSAQAVITQAIDELAAKPTAPK
jgi:pimeloyl-ACP methyl ester carboxylesterase